MSWECIALAIAAYLIGRLLIRPHLTRWLSRDEELSR